MHITIQLALQAATLISLVLGFLGLINTINSYRRQMNVQILMKYTERYERILGEFPQESLPARFDTKELPPGSPQLTLCVLKYLNLCSEEYYLKEHRYLSRSLWTIWESDLQRIIASPLFRREWPELKREFLSHPEFLTYVDNVQAKGLSSHAARA